MWDSVTGWIPPDDGDFHAGYLLGSTLGISLWKGREKRKVVWAVNDVGLQSNLNKGHS